MKKFFAVFALFCAMFFFAACGDIGEVNVGDINIGSQSDTTDTDTNQDNSDSSSETEEPNDNTDTATSNEQQGELGGECYPNKTCNDGLECNTENNTCVKENTNNNDSTSDDDTDTTDSDDSQSDNDADSSDSGDSQSDDSDSSDSTDDADSSDSGNDSGDSSSDDDADSDSGDSSADADSDGNSSYEGECELSDYEKKFIGTWAQKIILRSSYTEYLGGQQNFSSAITRYLITEIKPNADCKLDFYKKENKICRINGFVAASSSLLLPHRYEEAPSSKYNTIFFHWKPYDIEGQENTPYLEIGENGSFKLNRDYELRGATMVNPATESMISDENDPRIFDQDEDGHSGFTFYNFDGVQRLSHVFTGLVKNDNKIEGNVEWSEEEFIFATSNSSSVLRTHVTDSEKSVFQLVKVNDSITCDELLEKTDEIFDISDPNTDIERSNHCIGLPENAAWNSVGVIRQTWDGTEWIPSTTGHYDSTASKSNCIFKCNENYLWLDSEKKCSTTTDKITLGNICTGQNKCYDNSQEIPCPTTPSGTDDEYNFYGQDAQYADLGICTPQNFNVRSISYQKVVEDLNTGLMWQQARSDSTDTTQGLTYCRNLVYAGFSDWRLPTFGEFRTIVDYSRDNPRVDTNYFPYMTGVYFLTTTDDFYPFYTDGNIEKATMCVRGNELPKGVFSEITAENNDIIVKDSRTGLIWQKQYVSNKKWQEALKHCEDSTYANYTDWRLPNINELLSLYNDDKASAPFSDFPGMPSTDGLFWWSSSTAPDTNNTNIAMGISFSYGYAIDGKNETNMVLCVRSE